MCVRLLLFGCGKDFVEESRSRGQACLKSLFLARFGDTINQLPPHRGPTHLGILLIALSPPETILRSAATEIATRRSCGIDASLTMLSYTDLQSV